MKLVIPLLVAVTLMAAGCATTKNGAANMTDKPRQEEKQPAVGMTQDQIVALFGKTDNKRVTSQGETWIYSLNMGEMFIPFNFGYRPKTRVINFDQNGVVTDWSYSQ